MQILTPSKEFYNGHKPPLNVSWFPAGSISGFGPRYINLRCRQRRVKNSTTLTPKNKTLVALILIIIISTKPPQFSHWTESLQQLEFWQTSNRGESQNKCLYQEPLFSWLGKLVWELLVTAFPCHTKGHHLGSVMLSKTDYWHKINSTTEFFSFLSRNWDFSGKTANGKLKFILPHTLTTFLDTVLWAMVPGTLTINFVNILYTQKTPNSKIAPSSLTLEMVLIVMKKSHDI